jgi:dimethylargininase
MSLASTPVPAAALVREVSPRLADAELTFLAPDAPIDVSLARRQHADYLAALGALGLELVLAPPAPEHPDGVFVEDTAVVLDDLAILTRPGVASRRAEVASIGAALAGRGLATVTVDPPATLDGGDVLQVGATVYVGLSRRTDRGGLEQVRRHAEALGRTVVPVEVTGALHLKTAATALPDGTIVAVPDQLDVRAFGDRPVVAAPESAGANLLLVGDTVLVSGRAPATAELVAARGFAVVPVDIGELEKAEAGPTCLSVLLPAR